MPRYCLPHVHPPIRKPLIRSSLLFGGFQPTHFACFAVSMQWWLCSGCRGLVLGGGNEGWSTDLTSLPSSATFFFCLGTGHRPTSQSPQGVLSKNSYFGWKVLINFKVWLVNMCQCVGAHNLGWFGDFQVESFNSELTSAR